MIKLVATQRADTHYLESATIILELAKRATELFKSQNAEQKRKMIDLIVSNYSYKDGNIDLALKPVFQHIMTGAKARNWCARQELNLWPTD